MKRSYQTNYFPPIPVLQVRFGNPEDGAYTAAVEGIVDTGADGTIVPLDLLRPIEPGVGELRGLRSAWGERRIVQSYLMDVEVENVTLPGIWVIGDELVDEVIVGRDVLNRLRLLLDGLQLQAEIVGY